MEYFLGKKNHGSFRIGTSLFTTALAAWFILDSNGISVGSALWNGVIAVAFVLLLGMVHAPAFVESGVATFPEYLSKRVQGSAGLLWSGLSVIFYIVIKLPLLLGLAGWSMQWIFGPSGEGSVWVILLVVLVGLYTIAGGYSTVVRLHVVQASLALASSLALVATLAISSPETTNAAAPGIAGQSDSLSWLTLLVALPLVAAWQWLADQYVLQRIFSARDAEAARKGTFFAASLMIGQLIILSVLWMMGGDVAATPLTRILAGLFFLSVISASLASTFQSAASLLTLDFYRAAYPEAREDSIVLIGRLATMMIAVMSLSAVATVSVTELHLPQILRQLEIHVAPPFVAVFLIVFTWRKISNKGIVVSLLAGEGLGLVNVFVSHYQNEILPVGVFVCISFLVTAAIAVLTSLVTTSSSVAPSLAIDSVRRK